MQISDDRAYYERRIETSLRLAREAKDPGIRKIHLAMVAEYRVRAAEASEKSAVGCAVTRAPISADIFRPISRPQIPRPS